MDERIYKVYMHTMPNGKKYVGITRQEVAHRWQNGNGYKSNSRFYRAILKYGWDNIKHEVLFDNLTQGEAYELEREMIALNESNNPNYGYNQTEGGATNPFELGTKNNKAMPPFEEIYNDPFKLSLFNSLIDCCFYQTVTDKVTITTYNRNGEKTKRVEENQRIIEPSLIAINTILDNYENEEKLKPLIDKLKEIKITIDD